ncbi:MAG: hypothetical protein DYG93_08370 [Leptolyngbya sp. PLA2]|nr:hypothetical protein [Leptolyngbya sp.]MCE7971661.1 hypothetical protein [Leptolyngbya sp. PL-A2]
MPVAGSKSAGEEFTGRIAASQMMVRTSAGSVVATSTSPDAKRGDRPAELFRMRGTGPSVEPNCARWRKRLDAAGWPAIWMSLSSQRAGARLNGSGFGGPCSAPVGWMSSVTCRASIHSAANSFGPSRAPRRQRSAGPPLAPWFTSGVTKALISAVVPSAS